MELFWCVWQFSSTPTITWRLSLLSDAAFFLITSRIGLRLIREAKLLREIQNKCCMIRIIQLQEQIGQSVFLNLVMDLELL